MENLSIYCADIGSIKKGNFAWAAAAGGQSPTKESCQEIVALAEAVNADLTDGKRVALGFEAPLFVPVPEDPSLLGKARPNENPSWSAGAGANVLATGLPQAAWLLRAIKGAQRQAPNVFLEWKDFVLQDSGLLIWEAFVSGASKHLAGQSANQHFAEAQLACVALEERLPWPESDIQCEAPYSLAGAALLWSGLSKKVGLLHAQPLVIRPGVL